MYRIRNGQNVRRMITEYARGTLPGNSVTCPVVDPFKTQVERT